MKKFLKMIEKEVGKEKFEKFVGIKNSVRITLMFVIDDTGSMSSEIQAAKDIATYIVNYPRPNLQVDYILSPFNDLGMELCVNYKWILVFKFATLCDYFGNTKLLKTAPPPQPTPFAGCRNQVASEVLRMQTSRPAIDRQNFEGAVLHTQGQLH